MQMDSWINGAKASDVKHVIDNNFDVLDKRTIKMNNDILKLGSGALKEFVASDWVFDENLKIYVIPIPYADYERETFCVDVHIKNEGVYLPVYGGYRITEQGIDLMSAMPYEGRVVIK